MSQSLSQKFTQSLTLPHQSKNTDNFHIKDKDRQQAKAIYLTAVKINSALSFFSQYAALDSFKRWNLKCFFFTDISK
jgi:hypothetical protein